MAIQEQVELLRQGAYAWNKWRAQHKEASIDLSGADLRGANFSEIDPKETKLNFIKLVITADLSKANLSGADLSSVDLIGANFSKANLSGARLYLADLSIADLHGADLHGAFLRGATFYATDLRGANLSRAIVWETHFASMDLRGIKGLETIVHHGPSSISTSTLEMSEGNIPEVFLRGAGLSDTFIEYVRSLVARPIEYYTCFLSYSHEDQDIAERLYADLQSKGVRCWYAPHELKPGDYYRHKIDESIRSYDKLVLILSSHSVESEWVEKEVETALKREESMDMTRQVLFPLRLDDAVLQSRRAWVRSLRFHRHIGDFTGWKDYATYQAAFQRLLNDLQAKPVKKSE